ncbi:hypothetical protein REPUB_Repub15cG0126800 [Reevesia pubescens]
MMMMKKNTRRKLMEVIGFWVLCLGMSIILVILMLIILMRISKFLMSLGMCNTSPLRWSWFPLDQKDFVAVEGHMISPHMASRNGCKGASSALADKLGPSLTDIDLSEKSPHTPADAADQGDVVWPENLSHAVFDVLSTLMAWITEWKLDLAAKHDVSRKLSAYGAKF